MNEKFQTLCLIFIKRGCHLQNWYVFTADQGCSQQICVTKSTPETQVLETRLHEVPSYITVRYRIVQHHVEDMLALFTECPVSTWMPSTSVASTGGGSAGTAGSLSSRRIARTSSTSSSSTSSPSLCSLSDSSVSYRLTAKKFKDSSSLPVSALIICSFIVRGNRDLRSDVARQRRIVRACCLSICFIHDH